MIENGLPLWGTPGPGGAIGSPTVAGPARTTPADPSPLNVQVGGDHYKTMKIQPVEYIHANGLPFIEGCIVKYASRWRSKGGVKDLEKIKHFVDLLIELESRSKKE